MNFTEKDMALHLKSLSGYNEQEQITQNEEQNKIKMEKLNIDENLNIQYLDKTKFNVFRMDGHNFSKLTKINFKKPFDTKFNDAMKICCEKIFEEFNFQLGFVGSDEISLVYYPFTEEQIDNNRQLTYNGKLFKFLSIMPSLVSSYFTKETNLINSFDCRHFSFDDEETMKEYLISRRKSVVKNSKMMLAQHHFSQKKLHKKSSNEAIEILLSEKKIDYFKEVDEDIRRGLFIFNMIIEKKIMFGQSNCNDDDENKIVEKIVNRKKATFVDSSDIMFENFTR
jgi:tRNA(His) 5'-end guanylyltransferase